MATSSFFPGVTRSSSSTNPFCFFKRARSPSQTPPEITWQDLATAGRYDVQTLTSPFFFPWRAMPLIHLLFIGRHRIESSFRPPCISSSVHSRLLCHLSPENVPRNASFGWSNPHLLDQETGARAYFGGEVQHCGYFALTGATGKLLVHLNW